MKIGLIQQANTPDIEKNKQNLKHKIREVAKQGAQLVVMQELHNSLLFCQIEDPAIFDLAETIPGPSTNEFGG